MKFSIRSFEAVGIQGAKGELVIGEHKEIFPLITNLWAREHYESQWIEALRALVKGDVDHCVLITDIQSPEVSSGICYWVIFREGLAVYLQERFSREGTEKFIGSAVAVAPHIAPRIQGEPEEQARVSEWQLSIEDVANFLRTF